ncbi:alpha/beta fold hydrolase [Sphaerisporangium corydalis]|uniref:Alpha/beta fold hydrolase n=1 Tax=Sphaerisporangium corydalis TaxID=1441875 RepID=A0ABV9EHI9_9ACTN|nr:alpha/beta hydrolase [Sphaerisporangium corydalis]
MSTFVLVPGFWLGAWAWREVAGPLRAAGHTVHPLTLTGLADRAHLGGPATDLDTHVEDIVATLVHEDLRDVVLVAHSGAGAPVTGAADRVPERVGKVVYLDSGPLAGGTRPLDQYPPDVQKIIADHLSDGWRYRPLSFELHESLGTSTEGLDQARRSRIAARMTPQPYGALTRPLKLTGGGEAARTPKALVSCSYPIGQVKEMIDQGHPYFAALAGPEWELHELPTGHWPMFSRPADTARLLGAL